MAENKKLKPNYKLRMEIMQLMAGEGDVAYRYIYFENNTRATRKEIKLEMDWLRKAGYVEYVKGLMDDEGMVAGSGFMKEPRSQMTFEEYLGHLEKQYKTNKATESNLVSFVNWLVLEDDFIEADKGVRPNMIADARKFLMGKLEQWQKTN